MKASEITPASRVALTLASLAAVMWLLVQQVEHVSPGPLSAVHLQEPELREHDTCKRCHGTRAQTMAEACNACHEPVAAQIAAGTGFHGTLRGVDVQVCARCHGEHAGEEFQLVSQRSFRLAGFLGREAYDHAELDFHLQGRHAELACKDCHASADVLLLARGQRRFGGLEQGCNSCHEDAHEGRIVRACADCHGQEHPFQLVASFAHADFTSECAHGAASCTRCHEPGSAHDSEALAGPAPTDCVRLCQDCHGSSHSPDFLAGAAVLAGVSEGASCASCHSEAHGTFLGHPEAMPPGLHAASGFELEQPHGAVACSQCHQELQGDELSPFAVHSPARAARDCQVCHGDPHAGQFSAGPFAGSDCRACHAQHAFVPSQFGLEAHARSEFALLGSHEAVACQRCHQRETPEAPQQFRGTPSRCAECHADAHSGAFAALHAGGDDCATCHQPTLFADYDEQAFVHAQWTGFALEGAHARAECSSCHHMRARPDENGRRFGVVAEIWGLEPGRCVTCHSDAHAGRFDAAHLPASVEGRTDCARCHGSESFSTVSDFEHERWTGYPLADFHAALECAACHLPAPVADEHGRTFGRAPRACADCHADPHVGQFQREGVSDCARCHQDDGGLAFDHQRDSRYALDELHAALACSKCHVPWPLPGGGEAVRYKPLGTECADCHDPDFLERAGEQRGRRGGRAGFSLRGGGR